MVEQRGDILRPGVQFSWEAVEVSQLRDDGGLAMGRGGFVEEKVVLSSIHLLLAH